MRGRRRSDDGFTLIELMVVVLVIAILLAIAIPTFLGARTRSRDAAARTSVRVAMSAAAAAGRTVGTLAAATDTALGADEPALTFVAAAVASTGPKVVSVSAADGAWVGVARSESGACVVGYVTDAQGSVGPSIWSSGSCAAASAPDATTFAAGGSPATSVAPATTAATTTAAPTTAAPTTAPTTTAPASGGTLAEAIVAQTGNLTVQPGSATVTGDLWTSGTLTVNSGGTIAGTLRGTTGVILQNGGLTSSGNIAAQSGPVTVAGTHSGTVVAGGSVNVWGVVSGNLTATGSVNTCSKVSGTCIANAASIPAAPARTTPSYTFAAGSYPGLQTWTPSAFQSYIAGTGGVLAGSHRVTGALSLNSAITVPSSAVLIVDGSITFNSSITGTATSASTLVVVARGAGITTNGSVGGGSNVRIGMFAEGSVALQGSTNTWSGWLFGGTGVTISGSSVGITYAAVTDPGISA